MAKSDKPGKVGRPKENDPLEVPVATKLTTKTGERLRAYAAEHDRAESWVLRKALEEFLDRNETK